MRNVQSQTRRIICEYRKHLCDGFPVDIDPAPAGQREKRFSGTERTPSFEAWRGSKRLDISDHIVALVPNPRVLKLILRHVSLLWKILHGELDFDDLLMAMTLRYAASEAYDFLLRRAPDIRRLGMETNPKNRSDQAVAVDGDWLAICKDADWDQNVARDLVAHLFPMWPVALNKATEVLPQGVGVRNSTDYWERLNRGQLIEGEVRDQEVLSAIRQWKTSRDGLHFRGQPLAEALVNNNKLAAKIEQFGGLRLNANEVRSLASEVFGETLKLLGARACQNSTEAFGALSYLLFNKILSDDDLRAWVGGELERAIPRSLHLANDIFSYWKSYRGTNQPAPEIHRAMVQKLHECFEKKPPAKLCEALDPTFPWVVRHLTILFSEREYCGEEFHASQWHWFFDLLLEGAKLMPNLVLPQLVQCFFEMDSNPMVLADKRFSKKLDRAKEFFCEKLPEFMRLVSQGYNVSAIDMEYREQHRALMEYAKTEAKNWLAEHPS